MSSPQVGVKSGALLGLAVARARVQPSPPPDNAPPPLRPRVVATAAGQDAGEATAAAGSASALGRPGGPSRFWQRREQQGAAAGQAGSAAATKAEPLALHRPRSRLLAGGRRSEGPPHGGGTGSSYGLGSSYGAERSVETFNSTIASHTLRQRSLVEGAQHSDGGGYFAGGTAAAAADDQRRRGDGGRRLLAEAIQSTPGIERGGRNQFPPLQGAHYL